RSLPPHPPLAHREPRPRRVADAGRGHALRGSHARRLKDSGEPYALPRAAWAGNLNRPPSSVAIAHRPSPIPHRPSPIAPLRPLPFADAPSTAFVGANILIRRKEIRRIVLPLDRDEPRELFRAERRAYAIRGFARADVVHVHTPGAERLDRIRRRPRPLHVR